MFGPPAGEAATARQFGPAPAEDGMAQAEGHGAERRGFDITLWFVAISTAVMALTQIALGLATTSFLSHRFLQQEGRVSQEFLENIVRAEGSGGRLFEDGVGRADLQSFAQHILSMPGFLRANIYSPDGVVWWSSDPRKIGQGDPGNEELRAAFAGALITELGDLSGDEKSEHAGLPVEAGGQFIEAYIPVRDPAGRIVSVVEFYKSPAALDGLVRDARLVVWLVNAAGTILLFALFLVIVRRGGALLRRQQSELAGMEARALVGEMAGAVAHSLRNPLASLRSSAELAAMEQPALAPAMEEMTAEIDRMDAHIRDLLNYTRPETPMALQAIDPHELLQGLLAKEAQHLRRLGIRAKLTDRRRAGEAILADPAPLRQAIAGLLANAAEAMPQGGDLEIAVDSISQGHRRQVRITLGDTGRGIPPAILARVCEPFFTTKPRGLGLGLALTRQIVTRCMGTLAIESREGRGTLVKLDFAVQA